MYVCVYIRLKSVHVRVWCMQRSPQISVGQISSHSVKIHCPIWCPGLSVTVCLPTSGSLSVCLSLINYMNVVVRVIYLSSYPWLFSSRHYFIYFALFVCLSDCLSTRLPMCMFACMYVCIYVWKVYMWVCDVCKGPLRIYRRSNIPISHRLFVVWLSVSVCLPTSGSLSVCLSLINYMNVVVCV